MGRGRLQESAPGWFQPMPFEAHHYSPIAMMRMRSFLHWLGIPGGQISNSAVWDGSTLPYCPALPTVFALQAAHWLVAAPSRRRLPDFGLGDPDAEYGVGAIVSPEEARREDHRAVLLGVSCCEALGLTCPITGRVRFEGWDMVNQHHDQKMARVWLTTNGLLDDDLRVTGRRCDWEEVSSC